MTGLRDRSTGLNEEDIPTIPNVDLRRYRGAKDIPEMTAVINQSRDADGVGFVIAEEDLVAQYKEPLDFDPETDVLIAEADGRMIGLARTWYKDLKDGRRAYSHSVELLKDWRGKGIREELFSYNEKHVLDVAAGQGKLGKAVIEIWAADADNDWKGMVVSAGYMPIQHELDLVRSLKEIPEIPLPKGFEIRPVRPEHYEAIRLANRDAWKNVWNFSEKDWDEDHFEVFKKRSTFQPDLFKVAWKGDTLAGMILNYISEDENAQLGTKRGHTEYVYVKEEFRGKGLARALMASSLEVIKERGMDEAMLSAEVENVHDSVGLYLSMGFRIVRHFTWYQKPVVGS